MADAVILALPYGPIASLARTSAVLRGATTLRAVHSIRPVAAGKLLLTYRLPWWTGADVSGGRSTRDLPVRQVLYLHGGTVVVYPNGLATGFWDRLPDGERAGTAHAMLLELHGVAQAATWRHWPAGWHVWRVGVDSAAVIRTIRRPVAEESVYIVSDSWSHDQGSMQGSLASPECTLQDEFGLAWPLWLRREGVRLGPRQLAEAS